MILGEIGNWADLGGADAPIHVHMLVSGTDKDALLKAMLLGDRKLAAGIRLHMSDAAISDAVANDPLAIGVTSFSEVGNARPLALDAGCGVATASTRLAIKNADYPRTTNLSLVYRQGELPDAVTNYIDYLKSDAAQGPIRQSGYIDTLRETQGLMDQGQRLANAVCVVGLQSSPSELRRLVETLEGQARLTATFRFKPKSSDLDAASISAVSKLAAAIDAGAFDGRKLTFVGFTYGVGSAAQNLRIGTARARIVEAAVRAALIGQSGDSLGSDAFGEAMPIACDDVDWGRHVNRRVEVWVD